MKSRVATRKGKGARGQAYMNRLCAKESCEEFVSGHQSRALLSLANEQASPAALHGRWRRRVHAVLGGDHNILTLNEAAHVLTRRNMLESDISRQLAK